MGLIETSWNCKETPSDKVYELIDKRSELRKQKKFKEADKIRKQIKKLGFELNDDDEKDRVIIRKAGERY